MKRILTPLFIFLAFICARTLCAQEEHTIIEELLSIQTGGSVDVFNEVYEARKADLDGLIAPVFEGTTLMDAVSTYQKDKSKDSVVKILNHIASKVFTDDKVNFNGTDVFTLNKALEPDPITTKYSFDCDTSTFVYMQIIELIERETKEDLSVVLLYCPQHALLRWKLDDGSYINWETTSGTQSREEISKGYETSCFEEELGTDYFYADAYLRRGMEQYSEKNYADSVSSFDLSLALYDSRFGRYCRAFANYELKNYWRSIEDLDLIIEAGYKLSESFYKRGLAKYELKQYSSAISDLKKALVLDPQNKEISASLDLAMASGCEVTVEEISSEKGGSRIILPFIGGKPDLAQMKLGKGWYGTDVLTPASANKNAFVTRSKNVKGIELPEPDKKVWTIVLNDISAPTKYKLVEGTVNSLSSEYTSSVSNTCTVKMLEIPSLKKGSRMIVPAIDDWIDLSQKKLGKGWYVTDELGKNADSYVVVRRTKSIKGVPLDKKDQKEWTVYFEYDDLNQPTHYILEQAIIE